MKKTLLTFGLLLLISNITIASEKKTHTTINTKNERSFTFVEQGITFAVFSNGAFDFFLNQRDYVDTTVNISNNIISFNSGYSYRNYVQYDRFGAVIQIATTPIYYDAFGRVHQIGNIRLYYNRGNLYRIGNMRLYFNNYGSFWYYRGVINYHNRHHKPFRYVHYFKRPHWDYCVVSHQPYRKNYRPNRRHYQITHSKNRIDNNYRQNQTINKSNTRDASNRRMTSNVPHRIKKDNTIVQRNHTTERRVHTAVSRVVSEPNTNNKLERAPKTRSNRNIEYKRKATSNAGAKTRTYSKTTRENTAS